MAEKDKGNKSLKEFVDIINQGDTYKVLTKAEFENLVELASKVSSSTPKPAMESGGEKQKTNTLSSPTSNGLFPSTSVHF